MLLPKDFKVYVCEDKSKYGSKGTIMGGDKLRKKRKMVIISRPLQVYMCALITLKH